MAKKNYQQLQAEVASILERLQAEDLDIDQALKDYENGLLVIAELEKYLQHAENTVTKIKNASAAKK